MRPYSGIGVLLLTVAAGSEGERPEPLRLYEEPAIVRRGELNIARIPPHDWIFGANRAVPPLVVTARKGEWLRVTYDDAGREAWLNPMRRGEFQPWEAFFKGQPARLLPGLRKQYYQLFREQGQGASVTLTPRQTFRVVTLADDWALVLSDREALGWLRWRDEDGRLLMGLERATANQ